MNLSCMFCRCRREHNGCRGFGRCNCPRGTTSCTLGRSMSVALYWSVLDTHGTSRLARLAPRRECLWLSLPFNEEIQHLSHEQSPFENSYQHYESCHLAGRSRQEQKMTRQIRRIDCFVRKAACVGHAGLHRCSVECMNSRAQSPWLSYLFSGLSPGTGPHSLSSRRS
jgi:hypothetical protein